MLGGPTNIRVLIGWAVVAGCVGFAQLYRSAAEQAVGVVYLVGAVMLAAAVVADHRRLAATGMGIIAVGFAARAVSAFGLIDADWHGKLIIVATWGGLAWIAGNRSRRIAENW